MLIRYLGYYQVFNKLLLVLKILNGRIFCFLRVNKPSVPVLSQLQLPSAPALPQKLARQDNKSQQAPHGAVATPIPAENESR